MEIQLTVFNRLNACLRLARVPLIGTGLAPVRGNRERIPNCGLPDGIRMHAGSLSALDAILIAITQ
jgi:hypothetical protein